MKTGMVLSKLNIDKLKSMSLSDDLIFCKWFGEDVLIGKIIKCGCREYTFTRGWAWRTYGPVARYAFYELFRVKNGEFESEDEVMHVSELIDQRFYPIGNLSLDLREKAVATYQDWKKKND